LTTKELRYYRATTGNANFIWGLDFTFDDAEIGASGLDAHIRRIDQNSMELINEYADLHPNSAHIRAIKYFNESNDFASGCRYGDLIVGNFGKNEGEDIDNLIIFDNINVGYEIVDIESYNNKYIGVAGRQARAFGKFTIFELEYQDAEEDEITVKVFYKNILCETELNRNLINGKVTSFEIIEEGNLIKINLDIASDDGYTLVVSDISGGILLQEKYNQKGAYSIKLPKSNLLSGLYLVRLTSTVDYENIKKFILSR